MKTQVVLFLSLFLFCSFSLLAHQGKNKGNLQDTITNHQYAKGEQYEHGNDTMEEGNPEAYDHPQNVTADFEDFPNLHPLVVHVPIMMLPLAATLQLIGFFVFKREISWIVLGILILGFLGAFGAAVITHPNVDDLPEHAQKVYDKHDLFATWTLWLSGTVVLLKVGSHFLFKRKIWAEAIVILGLLASAYTVSVAGHYGSQLVFIEGVGPQGKYLEVGDHSH